MMMVARIVGIVVVMMLAMMVAVIAMMMAVPRCGWDSAAGRHYANKA